MKTTNPAQMVMGEQNDLESRLQKFYDKKFGNLENLRGDAGNEFEKDRDQICSLVQRKLDGNEADVEAFFAFYGLTFNTEKEKEPFEGAWEFRKIYTKCLCHSEDFEELEKDPKKSGFADLKCLLTKDSVQKCVLFFMPPEMQERVLIWSDRQLKPSESFQNWREKLRDTAKQRKEQEKSERSSLNSDQEKPSGEKRQGTRKKEQNAPPAALGGQTAEASAQSLSAEAATASSMIQNKPAQPGTSPSPSPQEKKAKEPEKRVSLKDMLYAVPERPSREWEDNLDRLVRAELGQRPIRISDKLLTLVQDNNRSGFNALLDSARRTGDMSVFTKITKHLMDEEDKVTLGFLEGYIASALLKSGRDDSNEWKAYLLYIKNNK